MKELTCLRCGGRMELLMREKLQLGERRLFLGDLPNLMAGALEVEIFGCRCCGKLEFYKPGFAEETKEVPVSREPWICDSCQMENRWNVAYCQSCGTSRAWSQVQQEKMPESDLKIVDVSMDGVPQVRCPHCGKKHDFDYPVCPRCNHEY